MATSPGEDRAATLVLPCLDEAATLPALLAEARAALDADDVPWTILVADNGSTDGSVDIALAAGAEVVHVATRGYGAAVDGGLRAARTRWAVYADADGTYRPADAVALRRRAEETGADLVLGARLAGVEAGAMPWLHHRLGTPILSLLIRWLHGARISDCNSGIRCVRTEAYAGWDVRSSGMEYASALLIRAAVAGARVVEVPVTLRRGPASRQPHLRTWRDGMRHLLVILAGAPWLFWRLGLGLLLLSGLIATGCAFGPIPVGGLFEAFGPHSQAVGIILGFYGALSFNLGHTLYLRSSPQSRRPALSQRLAGVPEDVLFWALLVFALVFLGCFGWLFWRWSLMDFHQLNYVRLALWLIWLTVVPVTLVVGVMQGHLTRRAQP